MRTFFCETIPEPGEAAELEKSEFDHLFRTLRAAPGDAVALFDGRGLVAVARVEPRRTLVIAERRREPEPSKRLHLYCAVPRRAKFDVLLKQAAELGVWSIRLLRCERSVAQPEGSDRWETLLREGAADVIYIGRAMIDDPHWGWHAANRLHVEKVPKLVVPPQYLRGLSY